MRIILIGVCLTLLGCIAAQAAPLSGRTTSSTVALAVAAVSPAAIQADFALGTAHSGVVVNSDLKNLKVTIGNDKDDHHRHHRRRHHHHHHPSHPVVIVQHDKDHHDKDHHDKDHHDKDHHDNDHH